MVSPSKSKGRKRLMALATFLHNKAPELKDKFSMLRWGRNGYNNTGCRKEFVAGSCGTSACGLGWGTAVPILRKAGLRAFVRPNSSVVIMALVDGDKLVLESGYEGTSVHGIVQALFGVDGVRSNYMFAPQSETGGIKRLSAKQEAARIRNTIKQIDENEGWRF